MQRTLVLVKPDGVQRGLIGEVISRLENRGLKLVGLKLLQMSDDLARSHYGAHVDKPFFQGLVGFITSAPLVAMVVEGKDAVDTVRKTMGETDPAKAGPGTIRGDLAQDIGRNIVHGSDSPDAAAKEIALFFEPSQVVDYDRSTDPWLIES